VVVKVEVYNDGTQWCARGIGEEIFTCGASLDELLGEIKDAAACHFEDRLRAGEPLNISTTRPLL
jgi:hypothetical protein